jgi:predicted nucleotidyltransferase
MRLTERQATKIREAVTRVYGPGSEVVLFGSRVDDRKRGGDIDLLVRPGPDFEGSRLQAKIRLLGELERALGLRKIDVVLEHPEDPRPIEKVARETGVAL